jgi:hypothetical protein
LSWLIPCRTPNSGIRIDAAVSGRVFTYGGGGDLQGASVVGDVAAEAGCIAVGDGVPGDGDNAAARDREDAIVAPSVTPNRELIQPWSLYLQIAGKARQRPAEVHRPTNP